MNNEVFETGARVRVWHGGEWQLGIVGDHLFNYGIQILCLDNGEQLSDMEEVIVEQVMTVQAWALEIFPQFCRDIEQGIVSYVELRDRMRRMNAGTDRRYTYIKFCLDDRTVHPFARAIRQGTNVKVVRLHANEIAEVNWQGVDVLAQAIAGNPNPKRLILSHFDRFMRDELRVDIFSRRLGVSQHIEALELYRCFQPSTEACQELCKSPITELSISGTLHPRIQGQYNFATQLTRFSSLQSVILFECPSSFVQSCLGCLAEHTPVDKITAKYTESDGANHSGQLLAAAGAFMESRAQRNSLVSMYWSRNEGVDACDFIDLACRHDTLSSLGLDQELVDVTAAAKIETFLKSSKNLRKLVLPIAPLHCQYGEEGLRKILSGVQENKSLHKLVTWTRSPETVLTALRGNRTLHSLTLFGYVHRDLCDFSQLRFLQRLRRLDISSLAGDINVETLLVGLKENTSVEEIVRRHVDRNDEQTQSHLRLNRWFNRYRTIILRSPKEFARAEWPFLFANVSDNVNALYCFVHGYPDIFDTNQAESVAETQL